MVSENCSSEVDAKRINLLSNYKYPVFDNDNDTSIIEIGKIVGSYKNFTSSAFYTFYNLTNPNLVQ